MQHFKCTIIQHNRKSFIRKSWIHQIKCIICSVPVYAFIIYIYQGRNSIKIYFMYRVLPHCHYIKQRILTSFYILYIYIYIYINNLKKDIFKKLFWWHPGKKDWHFCNIRIFYHSWLMCMCFVLYVPFFITCR